VKRFAAWAPLLIGLCGCGEETASAGWAFTGSDAASAGDTSGVDVSGGTSNTGKPAELPPEKEVETEFGAPDGSPNFVFIPDPTGDRVVRIHGATQKVTLVEVGDRPTLLRAVPGRDAAVVLNAGSNDLSVISASEKGDTVATSPMVAHSNALLVSPDGKFAAAWFDKARQKAGEPDGQMQAVTLVTLSEPPQSLTLSVGFRIRSVQFAQDGSRAVVVTDDGVSVALLGSVKDGQIVAPVAISPDPLANPKEREVQTTPDATWALVRQSGLQGLYAVHLASGEIATVPTPATPTDLDLLPGSTGGLAVLRDENAVAFVTLPANATDFVAPEIVPIGDWYPGLAQLSADGKTAVLYTTVAGTEKVAALDLVTRKVKPVLLKKTVQAVVPALGARKVLLLHAADPATKADDPVEKQVDASQGYTLYDLDTGYTKLVLTPVKPSALVQAAQPPRAWLLLPDQPGAVHQVQRADFASFLTQEVTLGSRPTHATLLEKAAMVAIAQDHPSGRITFVPVAGGEPKTVTGYELNGLVK
jgi:hypothetical protein